MMPLCTALLQSSGRFSDVKRNLDDQLLLGDTAAR
jgi:hypothetical protein